MGNWATKTQLPVAVIVKDVRTYSIMVDQFQDRFLAFKMAQKGLNRCLQVRVCAAHNFKIRCFLNLMQGALAHLNQRLHAQP